MPECCSLRTSESHPLRIDVVQPSQSWGLIGMSLCPGKRQIDGLSGRWLRNLGMDLERVRAWGASIVVSLVEHQEFAELGVEALPSEVTSLGMAWRHLPIRYRYPPGQTFEGRWSAVGVELVAALKEGRRIFLHCKEGLGRTGTVAACLLREAGMNAEEAVTQVRLVRPRAVETTLQEWYVHTYQPRFE